VLYEHHADYYMKNFFQNCRALDLDPVPKNRKYNGRNISS